MSKKIIDIIQESYKGNITNVEEETKKALDEIAVSKLDELKQELGKNFFGHSVKDQ